MKKVFITLCSVLTMALTLQAQINTPAPSPFSTVEQQVGLTDVTVEYSRPSMKDRTIFGADGLVPFGEIWRTGANASTKVNFSTDVKVGGKELKKGKYALYTIPGTDEWTVMFYTNTTHGGVPREYKTEEEAVRIMVKPTQLATPVETFTIQVGNLANNSATLDLMWENTGVSIPVDVDADTKVIANIEKALNGPSARDYYLAASYYHDAGMDLNKALGWAQKANELDPKFWQLRREALILGDMKEYEKAIAVAQKSKEMATKEGNDDYVRMNDKSIAEWTAMLGKSNDRSEVQPKMKKATKEEKM